MDEGKNRKEKGVRELDREIRGFGVEETDAWLLMSRDPGPQAIYNIKTICSNTSRREQP